VIGAIGDDHTAATFVNNVAEDDFGFSFVTGSAYENLRSEISLASKQAEEKKLKILVFLLKQSCFINKKTFCLSTIRTWRDIRLGH
jgi:hypothetical protein